jgi:hypothetical protein
MRPEVLYLQDVVIDDVPELRSKVSTILLDERAG